MWEYRVESKKVESGPARCERRGHDTRSVVLMQEQLTPSYRKRLYTTVEERFWLKVVKTENCWLWTGYTRPAGHGQIQRGRRGEGTIPAHVLSWELENGPLPSDYIMHHTCFNPTCVNPAHLVPVTRAQHVRIHMALKTECPHGHPLDGLRKAGTRFCRTCKRACDRRRWEARSHV